MNVKTGTIIFEFENSTQKVFLNALKSSMIQLRIRPSNQRPVSPSSPGGIAMPADVTDNGTNGESTETSLAPDRKVENADSARTALPVESTAGPSTKWKFTPIASTRIIGKILKISLKKGKYVMQN